MWRISVLLILLSLCVAATPEGRAQSTQQAVSVSMPQLLTTPEQFDGKLVSVIGFLTMDHEGDLLFAHRRGRGSRNPSATLFTLKEPNRCLRGEKSWT